MADESTIADKLTEIATALSGVLADSNTSLAAKEVSPADDLSGIPDQISAIETGTGGITPTGTKSITTNGTHDVTTYASANVNVPTGTVKTAEDITVSGDTVSVPAGLYAEATSKSVDTALHPDPTISVNTTTGQVSATHTQGTGYVTGGTTSKSQSLSTVAARTLHPSTSDQTISAGIFLTGTQTFKGVTTTNLTAANIKSGVTVKIGDSSDDDCVKSVTGTYSGGGGGGGTISGNAELVSAIRTNERSIIFSGFTPPSGKTLTGLFMMSGASSDGNSYVHALLVIHSGNTDFGYAVTKGDAFIPLYSTSFHFSASQDGSYGMVTLDNNAGYAGFNSGTYYAAPIYSD